MKKIISVFLLIFMLNIFSSCDAISDDFKTETIETESEAETHTYEKETESTPVTTEKVEESETEAETVTESLTEEQTEPSETEPEITPPSILQFLKTALLPVGKTMYVWGGGWNEEDTGAGIEAVTLGVSERWAKFAGEQDSDYDYKTTRYMIHDGLDCSGFVGWAVYNVLETENGRDGYVMSSTKMAEEFSKLGLGTFIPKEDVQNHKVGDIMSMSGHVWISLGECSDGSVLLLHASPPGVIICGTSLPNGEKSDAVLLAEKIMSENYPEWYEKFPECSRPHSYLTASSQMRWNSETLTDTEGLLEMTAYEIADLLFE